MKSSKAIKIQLDIAPSSKSIYKLVTFIEKSDIIASITSCEVS